MYHYLLKYQRRVEAIEALLKRFSLYLQIFWPLVCYRGVVLSDSRNFKQSFGYNKPVRAKFARDLPSIAIKTISPESLYRVLSKYPIHPLQCRFLHCT